MLGSISSQGFSNVQIFKKVHSSIMCDISIMRHMHTLHEKKFRSRKDSTKIAKIVFA